MLCRRQQPFQFTKKIGAYATCWIGTYTTLEFCSNDQAREPPGQYSLSCFIQNQQISMTMLGYDLR